VVRLAGNDGAPASGQHAMIDTARKFASLDPADRRAVLEAAALMALAWTGLRVMRFLSLRSLFDRVVSFTLTRDAGQRAADVESVRSAVARVARRMPAGTCLVQALAADVMLRRRRLPSDLRFGVRRAATSHQLPIEAHAWVDCGDGVTIGNAGQQPDFQVLTR